MEQEEQDSLAPVEQDSLVPVEAAEKFPAGVVAGVVLGVGNTDARGRRKTPIAPIRSAQLELG